jgi:hypothetical protein
MAPPAVVTPTLLTGPGWLFWAPLLTALPANTVVASVFSDTWPAPWLPLGATTEGTSFSYKTTAEKMMVAEFFDPVQWATTSREGGFSFALASYSITNLKRAMNGGTITTTGATTTTMSTLALPTPGAEVRCMLGWEAQDSTVRLIINQALNAGDVAMSFKKAPDFSEIPFDFNLEIPSGATQPFQVFTAGVARA